MATTSGTRSDCECRLPGSEADASPARLSRRLANIWTDDETYDTKSKADWHQAESNWTI